MEKSKKNEIIAEIKEMMNNAPAIYLIDFVGMTVADVNNLRGEFYKAEIKYKVVKNTFAIRALQESEQYSGFVENLKGHLKGNTGIVFSGSNPIAPAKILKKVTEKVEKPKFKAAIVDGLYYGSDKMGLLASLLSKEELISGILSSLDSPVSGIVGSINAVVRDLASIIEEAAKKRAA
ncbi:MAG: 50S ribosomal protein L10 [Ignavibacteriota bacterium]|nr:50S ribosomal protein L10 [Ignavibacteriota bacterium]